ncbi:MAG: hypothetical protein WCC12_19520 [Anaerolineales bacterium]
MQKWEYAILDVRLDRQSYWRPWKFAGLEIQNWQNIVFSSYINQIGDQGWELVGFSHSDPSAEYWVFKRPKP